MNTRKLKILFITPWYPNESNPAEGIFVKEHALAASLYNEIRILFTKSISNKFTKPKFLSDEMEYGIRTIRYTYGSLFIKQLSYLLFLRSVFIAFNKMIKEGWKPDVIHAHVFTAGFAAVLLGKKYGIPVVISEHWSLIARKKLKFYQIPIFRYTYNNAQKILPVSNNLKEAIRSYKINNKFDIIYNTVSSDLFYPPDNAKINEKQRIKNILVVALLTPIKGIDYLIKALAQIKLNRQDFCLNIIGDGPNKNEYELLSKNLGLNDNIKFHGLKTKEEISNFMRKSDFFILPSLWENLPCVIVEALMCGLPVIATNVGGVSEIVNTENGIVIEPHDIDAIISAITEMLNNYDNYSSKAVAQKAKNMFDFTSIGKKLNNIYQELCNEK